MKLIFLTGIPEIDKSSLITTAVKRFGKEKDNVYVINFSKMESLEVDFDTLSYNEVGSISDNLYFELEKKLEPYMKDPNSFVVIDGYFTVRSKKFGHIPIITERFFKILRPNIIVAIEVAAESISTEKETIKNIQDEQIINRIYAVRSASLLGSPIKVMKVGSGSNVSEVIRELNSLMS